MVGADYIKLIWVPDTFFVNEKEARFHAATQVGMWAEMSSDNCVKFPMFIAFQFIDGGWGVRKFFATNTFRCSFDRNQAIEKYSLKSL